MLLALETVMMVFVYSCVNKILRYGSTTWDDDIKINLQERGRGGVEWIHLTQKRDQWLL
jgi:hypothetical protein